MTVVTRHERKNPTIVLVDLSIEVNYIKKRLALEISILIILGVIPLVVLDKS